MQQILKKTPCRIRTTGETQSYLCLSRFLIEKLHMILYFLQRGSTKYLLRRAFSGCLKVKKLYRIFRVCFSQFLQGEKLRIGGGNEGKLTAEGGCDTQQGVQLGNGTFVLQTGDRGLRQSSCPGKLQLRHTAPVTLGHQLVDDGGAGIRHGDHLPAGGCCQDSSHPGKGPPCCSRPHGCPRWDRCPRQRSRPHPNKHGGTLQAP